MKRLLPIALLASIFFWSCKGSQYTPETFSKKQVIFGSGGGVTGKYEVYTLLENGQFFYTNSISEKREELSPVAKKSVKAVFEMMKKMDFKQQVTNAPGNYNHFIKLKEDGDVHEYTWVDDSSDASSAMIELFRMLNNMKNPTE